MRFALFFLLYGAIQFYCAVKTVHGMGLTGAGRWLTFGWALLMTVGPLLVWQLERCAECHMASVVAAWLVFGWMGFAFLFFCAGLLMDLYGGIARLTHLPRPDSATAYVGLTLLVAALWLMGFNSARNPKIERLTIESDKVPTQADGLRIVQLTDVHLGVLINRQHLTRILEQVETLKPDILVSTGDLVDAQAHHLDGLSTLLADCKPRYGKFAVTGNHESYVGLDHALAFHERAGFRLLRGDSIDVAGITLAGIDDPAVIGGSIGEAKFLNEIREGRFVILLKHQPRIDPDARFNLQLSGHTHNGQIFPFNFLVRLVYPMIHGRHGLNNGGQLYVSRGAGSWGPPIRVFSPPEITLIELKRR
jgi:predicted MPP superfamily phosphohydrolase